MALSADERTALLKQARELREDVINITNFAGGAHIGGGLSAIDIMTILYFKYMNIDPAKPDMEDRDRFILSKGHTAVAYVPTLARRGYFDFEDIRSFNKFKSPFGMHPDSNKVRGCDASTGSLGHGLPMAVGMALGARVKGFKDAMFYCLMGDGECNEGSVWEALMAGAHHKLTNMVPIIDRNRMMIDGETEEVMGIDPIDEKLAAFGYDVKIVDGHNFDELASAIEAAKAATEKPVAILAKTVKGKGVDFMENQVPWHYGSIDSELKDKALASLNKYYKDLLGE